MTRNKSRDELETRLQKLDEQERESIGVDENAAEEKEEIVKEIARREGKDPEEAWREFRKQDILSNMKSDTVMMAEGEHDRAPGLNEEKTEFAEEHVGETVSVERRGTDEFIAGKIADVDQREGEATVELVTGDETTIGITDNSRDKYSEFSELGENEKQAVEENEFQAYRRENALIIGNPGTYDPREMPAVGGFDSPSDLVIRSEDEPLPFIVPGPDAPELEDGSRGEKAEQMDAHRFADFTLDEEKWRENPDEYDYPGVDTIEPDSLHQQRSDRAQEADEDEAAPLAPTIEQWAQQPDEYDLPGVDLPEDADVPDDYHPPLAPRDLFPGDGGDSQR